MLSLQRSSSISAVLSSLKISLKLSASADFGLAGAELLEGTSKLVFAQGATTS